MLRVTGSEFRSNPQPATHNSTMIHFERTKLANGLTVIVHQDKTTPMVAVDVCYNVGSRDEHPIAPGLPIFLST